MKYPKYGVRNSNPISGQLAFQANEKNIINPPIMSIIFPTKGLYCLSSVIDIYSHIPSIIKIENTDKNRYCDSHTSEHIINVTYKPPVIARVINFFTSIILFDYDTKIVIFLKFYN